MDVLLGRASSRTYFIDFLVVPKSVLKMRSTIDNLVRVIVRELINFLPSSHTPALPFTYLFIHLINMFVCLLKLDDRY